MSKDAVELKTERLLLRPFQLKDVDDVFEYARDPEWARYLPHLRLPYTRRDAEEFVADRVLDRSETHSLWAIVLEEKVVGGIGLPIDERRRIAELGYSLARQHWGEGNHAGGGARNGRLGIRRASIGEGLLIFRQQKHAVPASDGEAGHDSRGGPSQPWCDARRSSRLRILRPPSRGVGGFEVTPTS